MGAGTCHWSILRFMEVALRSERMCNAPCQPSIFGPVLQGG